MKCFAILPLALLANACASQADLEATAEEAEADIRELLEQNRGDSERSSLSDLRVRKRVLRHTVKQFERLAHTEDCTIEGVAIADWRDRTFEYRGLMMTMDARPVATIAGLIPYGDNNSGRITGQAVATAGDINSVDIEGLWMDGHIDADVTIKHGNDRNIEELTLFATRTQSGLDGHFAGVLAYCK